MSTTRIAYEMKGRRTPLLPPSPGKRLVVSVVLNVEDWDFDGPTPRAILPPPHGASFVPDVPNFAWCEWGMRVGLPLIVDLLQRYSVRASVNLNSKVTWSYPKAAELLCEAGFEWVGHGVDQRSLHAVTDERAVVEEALSELETFSGQHVRGWLGPGLQETKFTPDVLSSCGLDYVSDWVVDEVPVWLDASPRPLVVVPYSLELNDSVVYAVERHESPELYRRVVDTLRSFDAEDSSAPMVLALPLHPHLIGVRHRLPYLGQILDVLLPRSDTVVMTGSEICDWFTSQRHGPME